MLYSNERHRERDSYRPSPEAPQKEQIQTTECVTACRLSKGAPQNLPPSSSAWSQRVIYENCINSDYMTSLMYFGCNVTFATLPVFLPTIISEMDSFTSIQPNSLICLTLPLLLLHHRPQRLSLRPPQNPWSLHRDSRSRRRDALPPPRKHNLHPKSAT